MSVALLLGLDHAAGLGADVEQIVGEAEARQQRKLADRDAARGGEVGRGKVLHRPARRVQQRVDHLAGGGLGLHGDGWRGGGRWPSVDRRRALHVARMRRPPSPFPARRCRRFRRRDDVFGRRRLPQRPNRMLGNF
ncbi:MAG TPA: hypothetical protein PLG77_10570 [Burkholderiaceae bacterium]|nr:hypothetical protein [Burkholderiaceae bacterium]